VRLRLFAILIPTIVLTLAISATSCNFGPRGPKKEIPKSLASLTLNSSRSGLKDKTVLVITHIYNETTGMEEQEWFKTGNGLSEIGIYGPKDGNVYTINAEAEVHRVQPESYKVRIIDEETSTVVITNNDTGENVTILDFQFTPEDQPAPLPPAPGTPGFANDDIVSAPGGFTYRASIHQEGQPDWPPVPVSEIALNTSLGSVSIMYRSYIETLAGEARNNIINLDAKNAPKIADPLQVNYYVSLVGGITVSQGIKGYGGIGGQDRKSSQRVLVIHIEPWVQPGEYPFEIQVEYEGKNIGSLPVIVKVK